MINKTLNLISKANKNFKNLINLSIIFLFVFLLINNFLSILIILLENISKLFIASHSQQLDGKFINFMVSEVYSNNIIPTNSQQITDGHVTNVQIIHSDGGWANGVRSLFIYGTGVLRLSLLKAGGSPSSRAFVIGSTLAAESVTKILHNAINDPNYIKSHMENWRLIWKDNNPNNGTAEIHLNNDQETKSMVDSIVTVNSDQENVFNTITQHQPQPILNNTTCSAGSEGCKAGGSNYAGGVTDPQDLMYPTNNFISNNIDNLSNKITSSIMEYLKPILSPIKVNYSNELLANQLNDISILLFILSILIIILFIAFMFNIIFYIYSDKISNFFNNKYIKWYINFNKKIIAFELIFLGSSILYFMYTLSYGIHFLATHPIVFS